MKQQQFTLDIQSAPLGFTDITKAVNHCVQKSGIETGLLTVFIKHTSASLTIQENSDPQVLMDLRDFFNKISPQNANLYAHSYEGDDDMPAHIRTSLTDVSLSIPVTNGKIALGTWQAIYLCEHRNFAHIRHVVLHVIGE